jgi:hypothetical protein
MQQIAAFSMSAIVLAASTGVSLIRAGDCEEIAVAKELNLSQGLSHRVDPQRQLRLDATRVSGMLPGSKSLLGHTQNAILAAVDGHRLSNGFLAPMTC